MGLLYHIIVSMLERVPDLTFLFQIKTNEIGTYKQYVERSLCHMVLNLLIDNVNFKDSEYPTYAMISGRISVLPVNKH